MKFGMSAAEAEEEPREGGGGDWIRYLKKGDTTFRILQDPDDWKYYWEHYSPAGFSFPCSKQPDCPGCISDNEKMSKRNWRIAFNVLQGFNGQDYVNVYKIGNMVGDKLKNRYERNGTLTDRDYTVTKYQTSGDRWDFDVEGHAKSPIDVNQYELRNVEQMLADQWNDAWGDNAGAAQERAAQYAQTTPAATTIAPQTTSNSATTRTRVKIEQAPPPFEEKTYQEGELRKMEYEDLVALVKSDMGVSPPDTVTTSDDVVDWLMEIQA